MLELDGIATGYDPRTHIVDGISMTIPTAGATCLLGTNGAGKSTVLKAIMGLLDLHAGSITFNGEELDGLLPEQRARNGLGYVPQENAVFRSLTVHENLVMGGLMHDTDPSTVYDLFPHLREHQDQAASTLSGGEQKMLALGRALAGDPSMLLLDEPTAGVAPDLSERIYAKLAELQDNGVGLLIVEQDALQALSIAEDGYILQEGTIGHHADANTLQEQDDLADLLMGH